MDLVARFAAVVRAEPVLLDEASLLIAAAARPGHVDVDASLRALDELAAGCPLPTVDGVRNYLFGSLGFQGNTDNYYDPDNSLLDLVVARRTGIPITLTIVLVEVGRRLGVAFEPVGMPGHFLARVGGQAHSFVDAFGGGRLLDEAGCSELFESVRGPGSRLDPAMLATIDTQSVLLRVLANLKAIALARGDQKLLVTVQRLRCTIPGIGEGEQRELARLVAATN